MRLTEFRVPPLANYLAIPHNNRSDERIRTHLPAPALSKLQRAPKMLAINACELGFHETD